HYKLSEVPQAIRYLEAGHARGKVVITVDGNDDAQPVAATSSSGGGAIAFALVAIPIGVAIVPVVIAFLLNRRFRRRNAEMRPFRWGYYFSVVSFLAGLALGGVMELGPLGVILCAVIYGGLAWFFAQRHRWAWLTLTILSFNPLVWLINAIYLRKRWAEL